MEVTINADGVLIVKSDSETESFALSVWYERHINSWGRISEATPEDVKIDYSIYEPKQKERSIDELGGELLSRMAAENAPK